MVSLRNSEVNGSGLDNIKGSKNLWNIFTCFYICSSVHRNSRLKKSNKMQQYADIYLLLNYSTCFGHPSSWVHKTVFADSGVDHTIWRTESLFGHVWRSLLPRYYDLYQRLQLRFYVLLMMDAMDARNMLSNLTLNKYLHTVVSCWISST
jgi:hypothetical protein